MPKQLSGEELMAQWLKDVGGGDDRRGLSTVYANAGLGRVYAALQRVCEKRDGRGYSPNASAELIERLNDYSRGVFGAPAPQSLRAVEALKQRLESDERTDTMQQLEIERAETCKAIGYLLGNCRVNFDWAKEVAAMFVDAGKIALRTAQIPGPDGTTHTPWSSVTAAGKHVGFSSATTGYVFDRGIEVLGIESVGALHKTLTTTAASPGSLPTGEGQPAVAAKWSLQDEIVGDPEIKQVVSKHLNAVWEALKSFFSRLFGHYVANLAAYGQKYFNDIEKFLSNLTELMIRQISADRYFIFTGAVKLKDQLLQAIDCVFKPLIDSIRYKSVRVSKGVARDVVRGINFGRIFMGADSLYQITQTLAVTGASFVSTNLGAVVNSMASIVRNVFKLCLRYWEYMMMSKACDEARQYWIRPNDDWGTPLAGDARPAAEVFSEWFAVYARWVPSVAATVLRSRICGSNVAWLQFADMARIDPGEFTRGVEYLQTLAREADAYAAQSGVKILPDQSVKLYLEQRKNMLQPDAVQKSWQSQANVMSIAAGRGGFGF